MKKLLKIHLNKKNPVVFASGFFLCLFAFMNIFSCNSIKNISSNLNDNEDECTYTQRMAKLIIKESVIDFLQNYKDENDTVLTSEEIIDIAYNCAENCTATSAYITRQNVIETIKNELDNYSADLKTENIDFNQFEFSSLSVLQR